MNEGVLFELTLPLLRYMCCNFFLYVLLLYVLLSGRHRKRELAFNGLPCLSKGNDENKENTLFFIDYMMLCTF